ncbi:hypothetical protein HPB50_005873 [Hyalomma asiaticum]|uniref:Uncharacterized protein n=1 Tax=Hyalomma asiaticum TaxID=266040 RepID=A0ACB7S6V7_HYAAI|nr:hypothetical protein HPB50_005873 [Hyalomma asiaticum]
MLARFSPCRGRNAPLKSPASLTYRFLVNETATQERSERPRWRHFVRRRRGTLQQPAASRTRGYHQRGLVQWDTSEPPHMSHNPCRAKNSSASIRKAHAKLSPVSRCGAHDGAADNWLH